MTSQSSSNVLFGGMALFDVGLRCVSIVEHSKFRIWLLRLTMQDSEYVVPSAQAPSPKVDSEQAHAMNRR